MIEIKYTGDALWDRIEKAVEKVKDRLRRVTQALNAANIPYAIIGGNAVQHWVAQVDESVVRNTQDVDIILNEPDLDRAIEVLGKVGSSFDVQLGFRSFWTGLTLRHVMQSMYCFQARRFAKSTQLPSQRLISMK